jgi:hypothetical protein
MEMVKLENSDVEIWAHPNYACKGTYCTVHNRSNHSMRSFPQHWRSDRAIMERICPHGVGHPDPDEYKLIGSKYEGVHGCDGCCQDKMD